MLHVPQAPIPTYGAKNTMRFAPPVLLIFLAGILMTNEAWAACPSPYTGAASLCTGSPVWTCDLTTGGMSNAGTAYIIRGYTANMYTAFGVDGGGAYFCSETNTSGITSIELYGTAFDDSLYFYWSTYDLDAPSGQILAEMFGMNSGDSVMEGSRSTSTTYLEILHGGQGEDIITGNDGIDEIYGDGDDDDIEGGGGNDTIHGGYGDDTIRGESGADSVWGDEGADQISGGSGNDVLRGGDEDDLVCGDDNVDTLTGGTGNDRLYGGAATDAESGDAGSADYCESTINLTCESIQFARPAGCPDP